MSCCSDPQTFHLWPASLLLESHVGKQVICYYIHIDLMQWNFRLQQLSECLDVYVCYDIVTNF